MATSRLGALVTVVVLVWSVSSVTACDTVVTNGTTSEANNGLSADHYAKTCPEYETIIYDYIHKLYHSPINNTVVSMIRWAFHDFFNVSFLVPASKISKFQFVFYDLPDKSTKRFPLQGADASFLLVSKNFPSNTSEKDSFSQVGMRNSKYVNDIKVAVDAKCPGVISCADTLAVAGAAAVQTVSLEHDPTSFCATFSYLDLFCSR